jgi:hypothetical protein
MVLGRQKLVVQGARTMKKEGVGFVHDCCWNMELGGKKPNIFFLPQNSKLMRQTDENGHRVYFFTKGWSTWLSSSWLSSYSPNIRIIPNNCHVWFSWNGPLIHICFCRSGVSSLPHGLTECNVGYDDTETRTSSDHPTITSRLCITSSKRSLSYQCHNCWTLLLYGTSKSFKGWIHYYESSWTGPKIITGSLRGCQTRIDGIARTAPNHQPVRPKLEIHIEHVLKHVRFTLYSFMKAKRKIDAFIASCAKSFVPAFGFFYKSLKGVKSPNIKAGPFTSKCKFLSQAQHISV